MNTVTIQRANVILEINNEPDLIQKYKDKGFNVIDGNTGIILERAMPQDIGALRARIVELEGIVEEKDKEIAQLKAKKSSRTATNKK